MGCFNLRLKSAVKLEDKKVYRITKQGKREFVKWLLKDEVMQPTFKDRFRLRMYFVSRMPAEDADALLKSQLVQRKKKLAFLTETQKRYPKIPEYDSDRFGDFLVLRGAILREQAYVDWLEESIRMIKESCQSSARS